MHIIFEHTYTWSDPPDQPAHPTRRSVSGTIPVYGLGGCAWSIHMSNLLIKHIETHMELEQPISVLMNRPRTYLSIEANPDHHRLDDLMTSSPTLPHPISTKGTTPTPLTTASGTPDCTSNTSRVSISNTR